MSSAVIDRAFIRDLFRQIEEVGQHIIEHPKTGMLMVLVPAGTFLTETGDGTLFEVDLPSYYVAVHPVTNVQYARFVAETGHRKPEHSDFKSAAAVWKNGTFPPGQADHPVVCVSGEDAKSYCRWAGLRLPSEQEWEKAARGLDGRAYPWGKDRDPKCCWDAARNYHNKANVWRYGRGGAPFGGLQFSGNVWEWCESGFVLRGGLWITAYHRSSSASYRHLVDPLYGFRCVWGVEISL
jgi:formylglycine-generating enzyme required for sulfatase activity